MKTTNILFWIGNIIAIVFTIALSITINKLLNDNYKNRVCNNYKVCSYSDTNYDGKISKDGISGIIGFYNVVCNFVYIIFICVTWWSFYSVNKVKGWVGKVNLYIIPVCIIYLLIMFCYGIYIMTILGNIKENDKISDDGKITSTYYDVDDTIKQHLKVFMILSIIQQIIVTLLNMLVYYKYSSVFS